MPKIINNTSSKNTCNTNGSGNNQSLMNLGDLLDVDDAITFSSGNLLIGNGTNWTTTELASNVDIENLVSNLADQIVSNPVISQAFLDDTDTGLTTVTVSSCGGLSGDGTPSNPLTIDTSTMPKLN